MRFLEICKWVWRPGYISIAIAVVVAAGSLMPAEEVGSLPGSEFVKHAFPYALLSFFTVLAARGRVNAVLVLVGVFAYGLLLEVIQPLFARTFDPVDLIANAVGGLAGLGAVLLFKRVIRLIPALESGSRKQASRQ